MIYILSYQLQTPDKDYAPLYKYIEHSIGDSAIHVLRDSWWIGTKQEINVNEVADQVREYMGEKDSVFIARLSTDVPINGWLPSSHWAWFSSNK